MTAHYGQIIMATQLLINSLDMTSPTFRKCCKACSHCKTKLIEKIHTPIE